MTREGDLKLSEGVRFRGEGEHRPGKSSFPSGRGTWRPGETSMRLVRFQNIGLVACKRCALLLLTAGLDDHELAALLDDASAA